MLERLKSITVWQTAVGVIAGIAFLAVLIRNWQAIKPALTRLTACFRRSKDNQYRLQEHDVKLVEIQKDVKKIKNDLTNLETSSREYRKTSLSDKIFKKYRKYKSIGHITRDEIVNFHICIDRYRKCIDETEIESDIVLNKYLVDVLDLEVVEE